MCRRLCLWLLVMLAIPHEYFTTAKQAQVSMCLYNQILGITGVNCTDSSATEGIYNLTNITTTISGESHAIKIQSKMAKEETEETQHHDADETKNKLNTCSS